MPDGVNQPPERPRWATDLNDEQRRAVEHGMEGSGGPLAVLAGPGTGKTRVITHRVARLIGADGVRPESVVALTFTVKAAEEMRARLAGLVGPATAQRVNTHTFHGFGRLLLRRFGDVVGLKRRWMLIDSAQRKRLLEEVIFDGRLFPQSAARGRTVEAPALERFICDCRNRAIFPDDCLAHADRWNAACERNVQGLGDDELAAERMRVAMFLDRARGYAAFERVCRRRSWLTFDDLLTLPIRLLRQSREVAALCRDEYRHIVVDEFQDVNGAQIELLRLLAPARGGSRAGPDLCVVGDDDQAIYAFRGATERAFAHFERLWPGCATVELSQNYRSSEHVLNAANAVIRRAGRRFAPEKAVYAATPKQSAGTALPEGVILDDDGSCGAAVAAMIRADRAANPGRPWREYAVIARTNADLDRIGGQLELDGIPVRYLRALDAGSHEVVRDLKAWIELLVDPRARWAVQRALARPPLGVPAVQVGEWVLAHKAEVATGRARGDVGVDVGEGGNEGEAFIAWLRRRILPRADAPPGLRRFFELHSELSGLMLHEPAHTVILRIIEIVGLVEAGLGDAGGEDQDGAAGGEGHERARRVASLVAFLRFSRSRIDRIDQPGGLAEFWAYYQDLDEMDQRSLCADDEDRIEGDGAAFEDDDDTDSVTVLTAHKAKGLEFDVVFVPRVRPGGFPASRRQDEEDLLPRELRAGAAAAPESEEDEALGRADEERRLFYVACTRARKRLVLLAKRKRSRGSAADYFIELTQDEQGLVSLHSADGIIAAGAGGAPEVHDGEAAAAGAPGSDPRRRLGLRLRREARARLGSLTLRAELDGLGAPEVATISGEMGETAARLAMAAHVERTGAVPAWALARSSPIAEAAALVAARIAEGAAPGSLPILRPMRPPLKLSFSAVSAYERCPRCFYLAQTLGLEEDPGPMMLVGQAAHGALERFYRLVRDADAAGRPAPGAHELVRLGLEQLDEVWPRSRPLERADRDRLAAQLALFHERLHDPAANILEIEVWAGFAYEHNGVVHDLHARLDRVDQLPDGRIRIVDYKTGHASRRLLEPEPDDLQLGIYAMAARALLGGAGAGANGEGDGLKGQAEYWCLSTGQRGVIDLASIDETRVRERLNSAIDGMLAGRFPRGEKCMDGACGIFDLDE